MRSLFVLVSAFIIACSSSSDPTYTLTGDYRLTAVNGIPVPASSLSGYTVAGGAFTLGDTAYRFTLSIRTVTVSQEFSSAGSARAMSSGYLIADRSAPAEQGVAYLDGSGQFTVKYPADTTLPVAIAGHVFTFAK